MIIKLKKFRDDLFPLHSSRRNYYDLVRKIWLVFLTSGPKGVYKEVRWRLSKPRRLVTLKSEHAQINSDQRLLFGDTFFNQIIPIPVPEIVDIIICVGSNKENILSCLSSIKKHTREGSYKLHLVVHQDDIPNLPSDLLTSEIHLVAHNMRLFNYSRANNMVLRDCKNDAVLLNDDTEVTENWLELLKSDSKGVALTGAHTVTQRSGNPQMWEPGQARLTNYPINMFCAYIPSRLKSVVGLLDEEFCYYGGEDVDYSCRTLQNGFPLIISSAFVHHKDNQSYGESKELLMKESDRIILEKYGIQAPFDLSAIKPKVSIILATRNRPELLKTAINSVLNIAYDDFELLLVDDYSSKETQEVIFYYQQKDDRIVSIRLPVNLGLSKARSIGLNASQGQFIFFTDDDDTVLPNRIHRPLEFLMQHPWLDVVYCNYNLVSDDGQVTPVHETSFDLQAFLDLKFNIGSGILFGRKQTFQAVPFMSIYDKAVDYDWVFRLIRMGYKIDLCPEIVMNYNRTGAPRYHLSGNRTSIDIHDAIYKREVLLKEQERRHRADRNLASNR